jgi:hypothetical protein
MPSPIYSNTQQSIIQRSARLFLGASDFVAIGTSVLTRTAKGNISWNQASSLTVHYEANLRLALRNLTPALVNYAYNGTPNGGVSITAATAIYSVGTLALTSATLGISKSTWPATLTGTVPVVVDLLAPTALTLATNADIYQVTVTPANPSILPLNSDEIITELSIVTPATSTFILYGVFLDIQLLP